MNRKQRRAAKGHPSPPPASPLPATKPGLVLRFFAWILLSRWVLRRVNSAEVLRPLHSLAVQAGRQDEAAAIADSLSKQGRR